MSSSPDIFSYVDYRKYLADAYLQRKRTVRGFSFRTFAQKADCAPSLLKDVTQGRRNLTPAVAARFAVGLRLDAKETEYLVRMSEFGNAKRAKEKGKAFESMDRIRHQAMLKLLDPSRHGFWSEWHHAAIRELATLPGFQEDPEWIARRLSPRITPAQAKRSLEALAELGLLRRNAKGRLAPSEPAFTTEYETPSTVVRQFNQQMIGLGLTAPDRFAPERREIGGLTLGLSQACYERVKERIRAFKEETLSMVLEDKAPSQLVCQLNVQLFPLLEDESP